MHVEALVAFGARDHTGDDTEASVWRLVIDVTGDEFRATI